MNLDEFADKCRNNNLRVYNTKDSNTYYTKENLLIDLFKMDSDCSKPFIMFKVYAEALYYNLNCWLFLSKYSTGVDLRIFVGNGEGYGYEIY